MLLSSPIFPSLSISLSLTFLAPLLSLLVLFFLFPSITITYLPLPPAVSASPIHPSIAIHAPSPLPLYKETHARRPAYILGAYLHLTQIELVNPSIYLRTPIN